MTIHLFVLKWHFTNLTLITVYTLSILLHLHKFPLTKTVVLKFIFISSQATIQRKELMSSLNLANVSSSLVYHSSFLKMYFTGIRSIFQLKKFICRGISARRQTIKLSASYHFIMRNVCVCYNNDRYWCRSLLLWGWNDVLRLFSGIEMSK